MLGLGILAITFAVLAGFTAATAGPGDLPLLFGVIALVFAIGARFAR